MRRQINLYLSWFLLIILQLGIVYAQQSQNQQAGNGAEAADAGKTAAEKKQVPDIYLAAKTGRLEKVRTLIAEGTDINASNSQGRTALMSAVFYRNKSIVRELLSEGVDVDAKDATGKTALMIAVAHNDMEMINLLLASGADVNIQDNKERTVLTMAEKSTLKKKQKKKLMKLLESAGE